MSNTRINPRLASAKHTAIELKCLANDININGFTAKQLTGLSAITLHVIESSNWTLNDYIKFLESLEMKISNIRGFHLNDDINQRER